ncbi:MAG: response regulator [Fibrobacteres bacterium]|jgi:CheY-like chemotaxis protein|nr:response regulator [Fibrobacterota bacterium]
MDLRANSTNNGSGRDEPLGIGGLGSLRILLVDDEPEICYLMSRLLKIAGHTTTIAVDGYDALSKFDKGAGFDLVVMDQNMPGMRGEDAVAKIRERGWNTPILITSGDLDVLERPSLRVPGVSVISKPFNMPELLELAAKLIESTVPKSL